MAINHRIASLVFALSVGLLVSWWSYRWLTGNPERTAERVVQEAVVFEARRILAGYVGDGEDLEISDPLNRVREAGKVYIFPTAAGWELSGQYQRPGEKNWHPFLMMLDSESRLIKLSAQDADPALLQRSQADPRLEVTPIR